MFNVRQDRRQPGDELNPYAAMVEQNLSRMGISVPRARVQNVEKGFGWNFTRGSATIEVYVDQEEATGMGFLQVLSPIMHLPGGNILPLYRHLLELNLQMRTAALGVYLDVVFVFSERPLDGLNDVEVEQIISLVARYADELDDQLVREFGGRLYGRI